uniref:Putative carotenoid oxygenase n=1 Tax=Helianthus annuus TaxID=4232 RepID=A0A251SRE1_HELAN
MLHALYFKKESDGKWSISYKNKHLETETLKMENKETHPLFFLLLKAILRLFYQLICSTLFGTVNKLLSNTSVLSIRASFTQLLRNHLPQEIDIQTLNTLGNWDVNGSWNRPFTAHPKKVPGSGELVTMGVNAMKPFFEIGVISGTLVNIFLV